MIGRSSGRQITTLNPIVITEKQTSSSNTHFDEEEGKVIDSRKRPQLPSELISIILQQRRNHQPTLYACTLVNRMFYAIATPLLWNKMVIRSRAIAESFLTCIEQFASQNPGYSPSQHIRQLHLRGHFLTDTYLTRLLPHVPQLTHLELSYPSKLTAAAIEWIPHYCQHLKSLHLQNIFLTRLIMTALSLHCCQLHQLCLYGCSMEQPNLLQPLIQHCPLEELTIFGRKTNEHEQTTAMDIVLRDHLTYLKLVGLSRITMKTLLLSATATTHSPASTETGTSAAAATTTTTCLWPHLTKFIYHKCLDIDDTVWILFIKSHPQLQDISLGDASLLTDDSLDAMSVWLPNLTHLEFIYNEHISPEGIRRLIRQAARSLVSIQLIDCARITKSDFPGVRDHDFLDDMIELDEMIISKIRTCAI
ncbi:hypothetical protein BCR42DRAFT_494094, partial [Absidia repens]